MVGRKDLDINQGDDFRFTFRIKGPDNMPEDLTGRSFDGQIRSTYESMAVLASFILTIKDQITNKGEVDVHLPNSALPQEVLKLSQRAVYVYDIEMTYTSGDKKKVLKGSANVFPEVTRI